MAGGQQSQTYPTAARRPGSIFAREAGGTHLYPASHKTTDLLETEINNTQGMKLHLLKAKFQIIISMSYRSKLDMLSFEGGHLQGGKLSRGQTFKGANLNQQNW